MEKTLTAAELNRCREALADFYYLKPADITIQASRITRNYATATGRGFLVCWTHFRRGLELAVVENLYGYDVITAHRPFGEPTFSYIKYMPSMVQTVEEDFPREPVILPSLGLARI